MEHTPVPWDVQNKGVLGERSARHEIVQGINRDGSVNLPKIVKMPDLSDRSYANARFIVDAVNAHDDLLAALHLYLRLDNDHRAGGEIDPADWAECYQAARAAIAKAEGG